MDQLQKCEISDKCTWYQLYPNLKKNSHMSLGGITLPKNGDVLGQKKATSQCTRTKYIRTERISTQTSRWMSGLRSCKDPCSDWPFGEDVNTEYACPNHASIPLQCVRQREQMTGPKRRNKNLRLAGEIVKQHDLCFAWHDGNKTARRACPSSHCFHEKPVTGTRCHDEVKHCFRHVSIARPSQEPCSCHLLLHG